MEVSKGVTLTYIGIALLGVIIFEKVFGAIWRHVDGLQQQLIAGAVPLTWVLAIAATVGLVMALKRHPSVDPFIHETVVELRKVTWPGWKDTQSSTIQVTVFAVFLSFFLWASDQVWRPITDYILTLGF